MDRSQCFISCLISDTDPSKHFQVFIHDFRIPHPSRIMALRDRKDRKVQVCVSHTTGTQWFISVIQVYSVTCNPVDSQQLCLTGRDSHLRIYDLRKPHLATSFLTPPSLPIDTETNPNMAAYSESGKELAVSYDFLSHTDKRIYIFPTSANTGCAPSRVC